MNLPDDRDYYTEPDRCTNNWRKCPCAQCEEMRDGHAEELYQRAKDKEFDYE